MPNFVLHFKQRKDISRIKSVGTGLAFRKQYEQFIHVKESEFKLVLWFEISKRLTKTNDILCGIVNIHPENSTYAQSDPYFEIAEELDVFRDKYQSVLLFGDYNSRTKLLKDYIEELFRATHMEDVYNDLNREHI